MAMVIKLFNNDNLSEEYSTFHKIILKQYESF